MRTLPVVLCVVLVVACGRGRDDAAPRDDAAAPAAQLDADSSDAHAGHGTPAVAADPHAEHIAPTATADPHAGHAAQPAAADPHAGHATGAPAQQQQRTGAAAAHEQHAATPPAAAAHADHTTPRPRTGQQHADHPAPASAPGATQQQHAPSTMTTETSSADARLRELVAALLSDSTVLRVVRSDTALARAWSDPRVRQQLGSHH